MEGEMKMVVQYGNLTADKFKEMGYRETVQGVPSPEYMQETDSLTKTQLLTIIMINNSSTKGYGQIRDYNGSTLGKGNYIPTESVPRALDEKGFADVGRKKQVSRRTGRTSSGFEKKKEGGYVDVRGATDELDEIAQQLGFESRFDDDLLEFAVDLLQDHPQTIDR